MSQQPQPSAADPTDDAPRPEPILFYGTSWVDHSRMYGARRFALGLSAVLLAVLGLLLLNLTYASLYISDAASWLTVLVILSFAICSSVALMRTWAGFRRPAPGDEHTFRVIKVIGFIGVLLAYAARSAVEAPGEAMRRAHYDQALAQHRRRYSKRSGNPAKRRRKAGRDS